MRTEGGSPESAVNLEDIPDDLRRALDKGGDMGRVVASLDWTATPLGPPASWPRSFQAAAAICLCSRYPMVLFLGPKLALVYNDAYVPVLGSKHPAMGRPGAEVWADVWHVVGPMLGGVMGHGDATWSHDLRLPVRRYGYVEEAYFTFSYSPIFDDGGGVGGVFTAVTETTTRVVGERRLQYLHELAGGTADARTARGACAAAADVMRGADADIPFALIYLISSDGREAWLAGSAGLPAQSPLAPTRVDLERDLPPWPLAQSLSQTDIHVVARTDALAAQAGRPSRSGDDASDFAAVLPVVESGLDRPSALLVAGISPRRRLDEDYRTFLLLLARQLGTALAGAQARDAERRRAEALAEIDRAKTVFFNNVSHEFRTPLTLLLAPLEDGLADPDPAPDLQRERMQLAHRGALRLLRLVNSLLDFARLQAGRIRADFHPLDMARCTEDVASTFRSAIERGGLRFRVSCPPLPHPVYLDPDMWERVVLNLLSNAFKFTLQGDISISVRDAGDHAELTVSDTGSGISRDHLPDLFTRFRRIADTPARTQEGTGIGLSLVHELVRLNGGDIAVDSEVGRGTLFTVRMPYGREHLPEGWQGGGQPATTSGVAAAPFVQEALGWLSGAEREGGAGEQAPTPEPAVSLEVQPEPARGPSTSHERILIVDDNADLRHYLQQALDRHWEVKTAHDGAEALAVLPAWRPDLVLTDVMMPRLDGIGLLRAIRTDPGTRALPVVMLSARAGQEATIEGLEAGADDYLPKPFTAQELVARVRNALELTRLRSEVARAALRNDEMRRAHQQSQELLHTVSRQVGGGVAMPEFLASLAETVAKLVGGRRMGFFRFHAGGTRVKAQAAYGFETRDVGALRELPTDPEGGDIGGRIAYQDHVLRSAVGLDGDQAGTAYARYIEEVRVRDAIALPWKVGDERLGIVAVYDSTSEAGFSDLDLWVLRIAAEAAGLVVKQREDQARALEAADRLDRRFRELAQLHELARTLSSTLDAETIAGAVVDAAGRLVAPGAESPRAVLLTPQNEDRLAVYIAATGTDLRVRAGDTVKLAAGLFAAVSDGAAAVPPEVAAPVLGAGPEAAFREVGSAALVSVPGDLEPRAVLLVGARGQHVFRRPELRRLELIARLAGLAMRNAGHFDSVRREADRVAALEEAKTNFLRLASHELGGPLAVLRGYVEMLREGTVQLDLDRVYDILSSRIARMSVLVTQMLEAGRLEDDRLDLELADLDLREPVRRAFESAGLLATPDHRLRLSLPDQPVHLRADAIRIEVIVTNLLDNAIKYSPHGGPIVCETRADAQTAVVEIRDHGLGIASEDLSRLFKRFGRIVTKENSHIPGTGLGLSISADLARLHGGAITAESEEGAGSTFRLTLPRGR